MIKNIKNCEVSLSVNIFFKSIKNFNDKRNLCIKSKSTANIDQIFDQLIKSHNLTESLKNVDLISEGIESITYNFTEIIISNTFIESPELIKNKKCTSNPQNKDNTCFQYSVTIALNCQNIKNNSERISKIKPFINNLDWDNNNFPPQEQDYKTFKMNNKSIALNILFIPHNTEKISQVYKSGFNKTRQKQLILLMITGGQKQHYLAVE